MADAFDPLRYPEFGKFTKRHKQLQQLCKIYDGTQYDGRPDWWTGAGGKYQGGTDRAPLRERAPCVKRKLAKSAVEQVVRFLFGDGRFPQLSVPVVEADKALGGIAVNEENAKLLQSWLVEWVERADVEPRMQALAKRAISSGTAVVVLSLRDGRFRLETPFPQHCWAQFRNGDPADEVERLVWCYEFEKEVAGKDGRPECKRYLWRRDWDATNYTVYEDVEYKAGLEQQPVNWRVIEQKPHGFSFCPVLWMRNECEYANGVDGISLYEGLGEKLEALDFTLSQRHRGLAYLGTPQLIEIGVEEGDGPEATGRTAGPSGWSGGAANQQYVGQQARKWSVDESWRYEGKEVDVKLLETSGRAFEVATKHAESMRSSLLEEMGVVLTSMEDTVNRVTVGADMSARFLALAHAPLLGLVSEYRKAWWSYGLARLVGMSLRMVAELGGKGFLVPGSQRIAQLLRPFLAIDVDGTGDARWMPPKIEPVWGEYFSPSSSEVSQSVEAAAKAKQERLVSSETATRHVANDFDVDDPDKELEAIEEEAAEAEAKALDNMKAEAKAFGATAVTRDSGRTNEGSGRSSSRGDTASAAASGRSFSGADAGPGSKGGAGNQGA